MPIVEVTLVNGRSQEELRAMISAVTTAVSETLAAPVQNIRVIIREVPTTHFAAGGVTIAERRAGQLT
jgi:4-oxalocrotonate tautomerase